MIDVVLGIIFGGVVVFFAMALAINAKKDETHEDREDKTGENDK